MLVPEFIDRYRRRLATPSERYIALHELAMWGAIIASILLGIGLSFLFQRSLVENIDVLGNKDDLSVGFNIIITLVLAAVLAVIISSALQLIYKKWLNRILRWKWPQWPDEP